MIRQLSALAGVVALACGPDITTNRDSSVPIPQAASWTWGKRDTISRYELDPAAENDILHQQLQKAIENSLGRKGWKKVDDAGQAQVLVTYHVGIKRSVQLQTTTTGTGGGGWWGGYGWGYYGAPSYSTSTTRPVEYTDGGLLIFVRDKASGNVAWQGLYKKQVRETDPITQERVQRAVDNLLNNLK